MSALMLQWSFEPTTAVPLGLTALWYLLGLARVSRRLTLRRFASKGQLCTFASGLLALVIALFSPIDAVAEQLFSAHMVQHLLLLVVAAPLLAWSRPSLVFLWAFPARGRKAIARAWGTLRMRRATSGIMHPVAVWLLFSGNFVFWHCPAPYRWAFQSEDVHALEHLSFLISALLFWTIVFAPEGHRRLGYGGTLIFVTTTAVVSGLPGALMLLAPIPLYPVHADGVTAWHLTLLQDQQLAGLIMWIPAGLVYLAAACFAFVKWLAEPEPMLVSRAPYLLALVLAPSALPLCGCDNHSGKAIAAAVGNSRHGARLIQSYGCGSCHVVPGIEGADGVVGPPLLQIGRRIYIAGTLRNTPGNLVRWLRTPQQVLPGNAMPDMGLSEADARDVAAYLYTLR